MYSLGNNFISSSSQQMFTNFYNNISLLIKLLLMIFDWNGLKDNVHFILKQNQDPLKYCNYTLPFPMPIGLPFMPCDLPNCYELYDTDETYTEQGTVYLSFQEETSFISRILLPASHRPWTILGKDYYNHIPYTGERAVNLCLSPNDRPTVMVSYQNKYVGKVVEETILNCCCFTAVFQQFSIYDANDCLIYKVVSKNFQRGHLIILPGWGFEKINYEIRKIKHSEEEEEDNCNLLKQEVVGEIVHLFNGFAQYTSKNDKYGITLPKTATEQEKCLLIYCSLFIDYLLFENF